ncbi:choline dehydrogenase-like flavoprotein [Bradyrhizobium sp. LM4.3]
MAKFDLNDSSVVVIVGSGAGGGTLGNELAQKGVKVVILEAGPRIENQDFVNDEWESFSQLAWADARTTSGTWRVAKDFSGLPAWIVKAVGGSTTHWAGASLRFDEHEFKVKSTYGNLPGANLLDWPITLAEMEPWYAKAENKMGVTRTNGIPGLPGNNNFRVMEAGAKKLGYKTVHTGNMAINSQPRDGRGACQQIGFCFQGCKSGARNGRRSTLRYPRARRPAISKSAPRAWRSRSSMTRAARSPAWCTPTRRARCSARRHASLRWPAIRSKARGCC